MDACGSFTVGIGDVSGNLQETGTGGTITVPNMNNFFSVTLTNATSTRQNGGTSSYSLSITPVSTGSILTTDQLTLTFPSEVDSATASITGGTISS